MRRPMLRIPAVLLLASVLAIAAAAAPAAAQKTGKAEPARVNVNTAGLQELMTLPGIDEAYARRLIEYREKNGPFRRIEDLLNVRGIGDRTLERIRNRVTVGSK